MAFDQATRNRLQKFVGDARKLLSEEFTRQLQNTYGLDSVTGTIAELSDLPSLNPGEQQTANMLRDTLDHYLAASHTVNPYADSALVTAALDRIVREQAFTVLNRLAALRMAEARQFVMESISQGYQSKGFQLYQRIAGSALGETGQAYQVYLFSVFDELSLDLAVLFDRYASQGRLFPRETVLLELLDLINHAELELLWAEDETVGWIYQYFNSKEERKKMRDESQAPRNSRELAVRNQFFTPRYVVEFLTDNTLGRIWYEMTKGQTTLVDSCQYLVRRPNEVFLDVNQQAPVTNEDEVEKELSQEELLQQTVYIQHRPLKDPRDIKMLDPACGSMHFGLYAFDLFEKIYSEAWDLEESNALESFVRETVGDEVRQTLHQAYDSKEAFLADVPRLIIENNIHGVDIDPRASQIAGLSLWLRAQKSWADNGIHPNKRPQIQRSNIVCAEPMPGEKKLLKEFTSQIKPRVLGQLVEEIFDKMQLAGEAGTLLKIEEEIQAAIDEAKLQKDEGGQWEQGNLFGEKKWELREGTRYNFDGGISADFWDQAEYLILAELERYAESATGEGSSSKRLFAADAAKGFAFIDLCRKRFDVVLMNPPFGEPAMASVKYINTNYPEAFIDVLAAFAERARSLAPEGRIGALTSRACLYTKTLEGWRRNQFLPTVDFLADLGGGVLDGAMVFACASVFDNANTPPTSLSFDLRKTEPRDTRLLEKIEKLNNAEHSEGVYATVRQKLLAINGVRFLYNIPESFWNWSRDAVSLTDAGGSARAGSTTYDDFRFLRLAWEVPNHDLGWQRSWVFFSKGGYFETFYNDIHLLIKWLDDGREVGEYNRIGYGTNAQSRRASTYYKLAGVTYPRRTVKGFSPRSLPRNCIFADKGPVIFLPELSDLNFALGYWNSAPIRALVHLQVQAGSFETGVINSIPWLMPSKTSNSIASLAVDIWIKKAEVYELWETDRRFSPPIMSNFHTLQNMLESLKSKWNENSKSAINHCKKISDVVSSEFSLPNVDLEGFGVSPEDHSIQDIFGFSDDSMIGYYTLQFAIGCVFGRWDIRYAIGESKAFELPGPFDPLPICPPGMLQNAKGLPSEKNDMSADYPLPISWLGILVDDDNHSEDIVARIRETIELIWPESVEAIEQEACEILGVKTLRNYLRNQSAFFSNHLKCYSKSRRKAPIYLPLQTQSGAYTLWVYYHRLNEQTLYSCVNDFIEPKLKSVNESLNVIRRKTSRSVHEEKELAKLTALEGELKDFRDELLRIAKFWKPNINDGVEIIIAPLWKLIQHRAWKNKLKKTWEELEHGKYDWSHMAYNFWPERVLKKCHQDRSIAIAHDIEDDLWEEVEVPARGRRIKWVWQPKEMPEAELGAYIQQKIAKGSVAS